MTVVRAVPSGRVFVSYRRARAADVGLLVGALHDRGVPTWVDTRNLRAEPTNDELRRTLRDPATSGAVLYLTPEVAGSPTILDVEAPEIMRRHDADPSFWVIPVASGGLDYAGAAALLDGKIGRDDLARWNIVRVRADPLDPAGARDIARACLGRRLTAVHADLHPGDPLTLRLHARGTAAFDPGDVLQQDWTRHFPDRAATPDAWAAMSAASTDVAAAVREHCPGRDVVATGTPGMPVAVLLGAAFPTRDACRLSWLQRQPDGTNGPAWSLAPSLGSAEAEAAGWTAKAEDHDAAAAACAVLVNVSDDTSHAFAASRADLPPFRVVVNVTGLKPPAALDPEQAASLAWLIVRGIREARTERGPFTSVHLFLAAPAGLAVLLGNALATLPEVVTYEYDAAAGRYREAVRFQP